MGTGHSDPAASVLRRLLERLPDPALLCEMDGRVCFVNDALNTLWGIDEDTARADDINIRTHPLVAALDLGETVARAFAGETVVIPEVAVPSQYLMRPPGVLAGDFAYLEALLVGVPNEAGSLSHVVVLLRDVTERRLTRAALSQKEAELHRAQKMEAVGRLASGVAHDFNNLLTAIMGYGALVLEGLPEDEPAREDVEELLRAAERGAAVTRQLLVFGRRQVLRAELVDLNQVVREVAKLLSRLIGDDVTLVVELGSPLPQIEADRSRVEQVIVNLAVNARDAMPNGGRLTIRTAEVELGPEDPGRPAGLPPGRYAALWVVDTGLGMSEEVLAHAFEPFFTTKTGGTGTGLGLATAYGIVTQSGGAIDVETRVGEGTAFRVLLPVEAAAPSAPEAASGPGAAAGGSETILLAEDDPAVRSLVRRALETHGYAVHVAEDGVDALRMVEALEGSIDLLVTDIVMPRMKGPELVAALARRDPELLVIYISGYPDEWSLLGQCLTQEESLLQKPFSTESLLRRVREVLDARKSRTDH